MSFVDKHHHSHLCEVKQEKLLLNKSYKFYVEFKLRDELLMNTELRVPFAFVCDEKEEHEFAGIYDFLIHAEVQK